MYRAGVYKNLGLPKAITGYGNGWPILAVFSENDIVKGFQGFCGL